MFSPFKYQYDASLINEEADDAFIHIKQTGGNEYTIKLPKSLLPKELENGQAFQLSFQAKETAQANETETLKLLLNSLIK